LNSTLLRLLAATMTVSLLLPLAGCSKSADDAAAENPALATPVPAGMVRGTVLETMDSAGYTYAFIDTGQDQRWIAAVETPVQVNDVVQTDQGMAMTGFTSKTLDRTFNVVYFVASLQNLSRGSQAAPQAATEMPPNHPPIGAGASATESTTVDIEAYEEGRDIAYVYANKDELAGQEITMRGQVVKYNADILGWNFVHIRDGSGDAATGSNDLIVTTKAETAVGETVLLNGTVVLDKDFGAGYSYPVLLEDASLTSE
jgi:hypothetical protein